MRYGSVCSGIEAASVAWNPLGWKCAFMSEIEPFPRAVLAHHYPDVPLHGDFTTIQAGDYEPIDVLVGGTPCQSFSVAGLRGGMADARGNLALEYLRLADRLRPKWLVWENVPGILSSTSHDAPDPSPPPPPLDLECDGTEVDTEDDYTSEELHAFNCFLAGLSDIGYGFVYRVLDAQYFGLAQRRKRVFVVGYLGDWRRAGAVIFEPASLRRNHPPRREKGEDVAPTIAARTKGGGGLGTGFDCDGGLIAHCLNAGAGAGSGSSRFDPSVETLIVGTLQSNGKAAGSATQQDVEAGMLVPVSVAYAIQERAVCENPDAGPDGAGFREGIAYTVEARSVPQAVAFDLAQITSAANRTRVGPELPASTLNAASDMHVATCSAVRRLTPRECERLQGFPDDYTLISHRKKPAADGPRYKAIGNSMAVPVMAWIGRRIADQHSVAQQVAA